MSKKITTTREKILEKALEMFNTKGVEYVGLRELAALLGIRVGNITYYFPTKDDLVSQLAINLNSENSAVIVSDPDVTLTSLMQMFKTAARIQLKYRGLLLSMVHLLTQNKVILERNKESQAGRNVILTTTIGHLERSGYLELDSETQKQTMSYTISLIARFWISEAAISYRQLNADEQVNLYVTMVANILFPHATPKGKAELMPFL